MTKLPQVSHERVVRALKRAGFYLLREGKHISMTDDKHSVIIPRQHVIKPGTLKTDPGRGGNILRTVPGTSLACRLIAILTDTQHSPVTKHTFSHPSHHLQVGQPD
ncbi:MAG: hypothetical protein NPIRA03_38120 [Nitrospirales bacterium]|nr:MAG: hypothetical protein NPIRA03_38120 [Nitrospirales bacterium]